MSLALAAPIMASFLGIIEASPKVEMEIGDQLVEARVDAETEVGVDNQPIEEGSVGLKEARVDDQPLIGGIRAPARLCQSPSRDGVDFGGRGDTIGGCQYLS